MSPDGAAGRAAVNPADREPSTRDLSGPELSPRGASPAQEPRVEKLERPGAPALAYQVHHPAAPAAAAVLLTHGYGEHRLRYREVIERWKARGILVVSYDLRGHGASEGTRGHVDRFSSYVTDAANLIEAVSRSDTAFRGLAPPVAFGHSLGGLITIHLALAYPERVRAVVLSSPYLGLGLDVPVYKRLAGRLASGLVPRFALPTGIRAQDLTHDPVKVAEREADPVVFDLATARWFTEATSAQKQAFAAATRFSHPLLCLQAGDDRIARASASRAFFNAAASPRKHYRELAGRYHEILNETDRASTIGEIARAILDAYSATLPSP